MVEEAAAVYLIHEVGSDHFLALSIYLEIFLRKLGEKRSKKTSEENKKKNGKKTKESGLYSNYGFLIVITRRPYRRATTKGKQALSQ